MKNNNILDFSDEKINKIIENIKKDEDYIKIENKIKKYKK